MSALEDLKRKPVENATDAKSETTEPNKEVVSMTNAQAENAKPNDPERKKVDISAVANDPKVEPQDTDPTPLIRPGVHASDVFKSQDFKDLVDRKTEERKLKEQEAADKAEEEKENNEAIAPTENKASLIEDDDSDNDAPVETEPTEVIDIGDVETSDDSDIDGILDEVDEQEAEEDKKKTVKPRVENPDIDIEMGTIDNNTYSTSILDEADESSEDDDDDDDEALIDLQKKVSEKIKPLSEQLNISTFTIVKKPIANINSLLDSSKVKSCKWVLPEENGVVLMSEFSGAELEDLRQASQDTTSTTSLNRRYRIIYNHIVSPKPKFEPWLKTTPILDVDHLFFAIYIASFNGANYLPLDCKDKKCGNTFVTDNINIMDMVKFDTEEAKNKFVKLYKSEPTMMDKGVYVSAPVPITKDWAIGFREPSIYSLFELAALTDDFKDKYHNVTDYLPYIDQIYKIDAENKQLTPVAYKIFKQDVTKTIESRIKTYNKIIKSFDIDTYGLVRSCARAMGDRETGMSYILPSCTCPKCGTSTDETETTAEELVFIRYQLGSLVNTSIK